MLYDSNSPSPTLLEGIMKKVNAFGHEPRVLIELDKISYVPGIKSKYDVIDWARKTSLKTYRPNYPEGDKSEEPEEVSTIELGDRFEYIKCAAHKWVDYYKLTEDAYYFVLAIAKHETAFGTLGAGRKSSGSYVLGYGVFDSGIVGGGTYAGIDTQFKFGVKRFNDAMKSRGYLVNSKDDVEYFWKGGDYGNYQWSSDAGLPTGTWASKVWDYYQTIKAEGTGSAFPNKWHCKDSSVSSFNLAVGEEDTKFLAQTSVGVTMTAFPIKGLSLAKGGGARVSSHHQAQPGGRANHKGIDIVMNSPGAINGKTIVAIWDGTVSRSEVSSSFGEVVYIKHPNGYETVYAHMIKGSRKVTLGQKVRAGQTLGLVGSTGRSSGPHLHFEIWKGGRIYGGSNHINPYPVLTGAQKIESGTVVGDTPVPEMDVTTNTKFNKCFGSDGTLSDDFIDKENIKWFPVADIGSKVIGFKGGQVSAGQNSSFSYRHNFSSNGYFEYSYYVNLEPGDFVIISYDGILVQRLTHEDNAKTVTMAAPVHARYIPDSNIPKMNTHILDFHLHSESGKSVFGISCLSVTEVEVVNGVSEVVEDFKGRKTDRWFDIGGFVYEDTFYIDTDIMDWEINTHFDMRSATARITLNNKDGIYSPNYQRTTVFPDNLKESPFSYYEHGAIRHIISEATPIRIYVGYGEQMVRVFTGKIKGEIEENSESRTVSFSCADMYDVLEEKVFHKYLSYPPREDLHGLTENHGSADVTMWVKSAIVRSLATEAGLSGWRVHEEDLKYPDLITEDTYYIDIDRGGKRLVTFDKDTERFVEVDISTIEDVGGYRNPYAEAIDFPVGTRAADAIHQVIGEIMYRTYCDRYGTFRLESIRDLGNNKKWELKDDDNLLVLDSSIDHSRVRNHLMVSGSSNQIEHFFDKDLLIATKGQVRSGGISSSWIDESYGATARGQKEDVANKLFFDMKRQSRTFNVAIKGNPLIDILDGCYVYDRNTSTSGYYLVKGNRLVGNQEGVINFLELTWEDLSFKETEKEKPKPLTLPPSPVEPVPDSFCGSTEEAGEQASTYTYSPSLTGMYYIEWEMFGVEDSIDVYVGTQHIFSSGLVSDGEGGPIGFYYEPSYGELVVAINEGLVLDYKTGWNFTVHCPNQVPDEVKSNSTIINY